MATIVIKRRSEHINRFRNYRILLDDKKIGVIANGETKTFETTPGQHKLVASIDWCSSPPISFTLNDGETKTLQVGGFKNASWIMPIASGLVGLHFLVKIIFNVDYLIYLVIPVFFILMYYLIIDRKKYLSLKEV